MSAIRILGIDPGFSSLGLALVVLDAASMVLTLEDLILVETKKATKKTGIRAKADDLRRLSEIIHKVDEVIRHKSPDVFAFEECPSIRQNAAVVRKVASAWGACCALAIRKSECLVFEYGPMHLKEVVTQDRKASKEAMIEAVQRRFPNFASWGIPASKAEHVADAVAACVVASEDAAVRHLAKAVERVTS